MTDLTSQDYIEVSGTNDGTGQNKKLETLKVVDDDGNTVHREMVAMGGVVDLSNTTTTLLASGATYTGTFVRCPDGVSVSCKSVGVGGTLYFDFSNDGTNVDTFPVNGFTVSDGVHEYHNAKVNGRYFRARFVSDAGTQTAFWLYTYFGPYSNGNAPLNQSIGIDTDASIVRPTDFQDEVRRNLRSGVQGWNKFGYRLALSNGTESIIWPDSATAPTILTTASTFDIAYDGTAGGSTDGSGTTGATQLTFYYLDANGNQAVAAHNLGTDGTDTTSFTGLGINRCVVSASGSLNYNASDITITATTGGSFQASIPAEGSVTQQCIFHTGFIQTAVAEFLYFNIISSNKAKDIELKGYTFNRNVATRYEIFRASIDTSVQLHDTVRDPIKFPLTSSDVLYFTANASGGTGTCDVICRFSLNAYDNV
jgi:hypothetical protein